MIHEYNANGERLIPLPEGRALIASRRDPQAWHEVSLSGCDCLGHQYHGKCRHIAALAAYLNVAPLAAPEPPEDLDARHGCATTAAPPCYSEALAPASDPDEPTYSTWLERKYAQRGARE